MTFLLSWPKTAAPTPTIASTFQQAEEEEVKGTALPLLGKTLWSYHKTFPLPSPWPKLSHEAVRETAKCLCPGQQCAQPETEHLLYGRQEGRKPRESLQASPRHDRRFEPTIQQAVWKARPVSCQDLVWRLLRQLSSLGGWQCPADELCCPPLTCRETPDPL